MDQRRKKLGTASLIAIGLAAAAQSASAQSNVTLYGIIDAGVEYVDNVAVGGREESLARVSPSNTLASRWGLRGTEDLGGGLKAVVNLESGFAPDTGSLMQNGRLFGRAAIVGLEGSWGSLLLGRQRNAIFDLSLVYDPMSYATYGLTALDNAFFTNRPDNSVKYIYKQNGLSATALYSFGRDALAGTPAGSQSEVAGASKIGRQLGGNVNYSAGSFSIGMGLDQQHGVTAATQSDTDRRLFIASTYTLAQTKLFAGFLHRDNTIPVLDQESKMYWVGAKHRITQPLSVSVGLFHTTLSNSPNKATLLGTSFAYDLSKRSLLYVNVGHVKNGGGSTQGVTSSTPTLPGQNQSGVVAGILHRF